ncbi:unnamed protein product [Leuciscus chuanchicus]
MLLKKTPPFAPSLNPCQTPARWKSHGTPHPRASLSVYEVLETMWDQGPPYLARLRKYCAGIIMTVRVQLLNRLPFNYTHKRGDNAILPTAINRRRGADGGVNRPASDDDDDITNACDRDARLSATAVTARAMRSDTSRVYPTDPCARSPVKHGDDMTERIRGKRRKQANPRRNQEPACVTHLRPYPCYSPENLPVLLTCDTHLRTCLCYSPETLPVPYLCYSPENLPVLLTCVTHLRTCLCYSPVTHLITYLCYSPETLPVLLI